MTHARRGFTLLELMVVLVLLTITAAAAVPAFLGDRALTADERVARLVSNLLTQTRDAARTSGAPATLVLAAPDEQTGGRYWITTRDSSSTGMLSLPNGMRVTGLAAARTQCRFDPAGPATPCAITVHGARARTVRVNAWSGEIRMDDAHAP